MIERDLVYSGQEFGKAGLMIVFDHARKGM